MAGARDVYEAHHATSRVAGYSVLKNERGSFLRSAIGSGKRVLDIGCRDGSLTEAFLGGNRVLGIDVDEVSLARAAERGIETRSMDLHGDWHELSDEKFDAIVAEEVLEHLYFPEKIMAKVAERLTVNGVFIGSVPNAFSLINRLRYLRGTRRHTPLADPTHITQFSAAELESMLRKHFADVQITGLGSYSFLAQLVPGWFGFDLVFVARTPIYEDSQPA